MQLYRIHVLTVFRFWCSKEFDLAILLYLYFNMQVLMCSCLYWKINLVAQNLHAERMNEFSGISLIFLKAYEAAHHCVRVA